MKLTPERRIELADPDKWTAQDSLDALETIDALTAELASARAEVTKRVREEAEWWDLYINRHDRLNAVEYRITRERLAALRGEPQSKSGGGK